MEENTTLKTVYTLFIGLLIATFVGFGIATFYAAPQAPEYPSGLYPDNGQFTEQEKQKQQEHEKQLKEYVKKDETYNRNVSTAALTAGILLLIGSLVAEKRLRFISNGVLLGGVFVLMYAVIRSFMANDTRYSFIAVSIGLAVALLIGYRHFVRPSVIKSKKPARKK